MHQCCQEEPLSLTIKHIRDRKSPKRKKYLFTTVASQTAQVRLSSQSIRHAFPVQHRISRPVVASYYGRGNRLAAREARRASAWDIYHNSRSLGAMYRHRLYENVHPS